MLEAAHTSETVDYNTKLHGAISKKALIFKMLLSRERGVGSKLMTSYIEELPAKPYFIFGIVT
jgi:hypothetical protein